MTLLADVKWTCKCGHENTAQLWHDDANKHCDVYNNGKVPADCGLNWVAPCKACGEYTLADHETKTGDGLIGWNVVKAQSA